MSGKDNILTTEGINFKAELPIQIRFSDIDSLGHINNNIYLSFFDLGKADYLDKVRGYSVNWTEGGIVIAHLEMDYLSPIFYKEKVIVQSKVIKLGNKSGEFIQQLKNEKSGEIKCICKSTFVYIDYITRKPANIPHAWREAVEKYEEMKLQASLQNS